MNVLDLAQKRVSLKKASSTAGGEWQGPCPGCGDGGRPATSDRFHVWPVQNEGKGAYWCRCCGKWGDNIQFLRDFEGLGFKEACSRLNLDIPESPGRHAAPPPKHKKPEFVPSTHGDPSALWQEKADKFIAWSVDNLARSPDNLSWLAERGISTETAANYRLGWNVGEEGKDIYRARKAWGLLDIIKDDGRPKALWIPRGLVIPYIIDGIIHRIRIRRPEGEPRYYVLPGSSMSVMVLEPRRRAFVVVEAELDAIAVAAGSSLSGAVALGSVSAKPDAFAYSILRESLQILNALDYDAAGAKSMAWWSEQFPQCDRWPVPKGKDPGEAVKLGIDLDLWIKAGLPPALTIATPEPIRRRDPVVRHAEVEEVEDVRGGYNPDDPYADAYIPPGVTRGINPMAPAAENLNDAQLSPPLRELYLLLLNNPGVIIINKASRYTVLRNGKYVGGRITELIFRTPEVLDYISNHPAEEIDAGNFLTEA